MKPLAAEKNGNQTIFTVWAPLKRIMVLHIVHPKDQQFQMTKDEEGYWQVTVENLPNDTCYFFKPDGEQDFPDPASRYQPEGVHGPSQIVDHSLYQWNDTSWKGLSLEEMILYELHVGTFTPEGTFEAIIPRLDELKTTGINALELMPVTQFSGNRNWGYDGVYPYAVQNSYGGPNGLKKLVDACHQKGIAVILDVVYNHLGPEGNYFYRYGPYFTDRYKTPWGDALNFDGDWSDGVRDYFSDNALYWMEHYHIDGLRCDAIHTVFDNSAVHFWDLTSRKVKQLEARLGRHLHLIAESDLNSPKVVKDPEAGGYGFSAQWLDDFHHALYVLVHPEGKDRYYDYGKMEQLVKAYTDGFVLSGEWVKFRKRRYGVSSAGVPGSKFIVFNINHDQVGNRVGGERLCMLVDFEKVKLAAAAVLLAPYVPMLFMGEEYADDTPFYYFVSHSDAGLVDAVRKGRKNEFKEFGFEQEPPDPQDEKTFNDSKIRWEKRNESHHQIMLQWHRELILLRQIFPVLKNFEKKDVQVQPLGEDGFMLLRQSSSGEEQMACLFNLSAKKLSCQIPEWMKKGKKILDSKESKWQLPAEEKIKLHPEQSEPGEKVSLLPFSVVVYHSI